MHTMIYAVLAAVAIFLLVSIVWRLYSQRKSMPCPSWLRWMVELDNPFTRTNRAATILGHLDVHSGMIVGDIGCGPGRVTIPLAKAVGPEGEVVAVDVQSGMLGRVRQKAEAAGLTNITFLQAGIGEGKLGRDRFDRAVLVTVLGEIPDQEAAMREIHAAMKPEGILSVTEVIFDPHFQGRSTVTGVARAVGFTEKTFLGNRIAYTIHLVK
jgi:ubiquinone/menaquinone biosynthesis C-methylase UbiE